MNFAAHIFKAYDIRGLVEGELNSDIAYLVGRAFVVLLREKGVILGNRKIVVGYDMRATSVGFHNEVMRGITDEGVSVVDIGLATTPLFNFACAHYEEHAGGIMVTASHNPAQYNGFKITLENGLPVGKNNGMERLRDLVRAQAFELCSTKGAVEVKEVFDDYQNKIFSLIVKEDIRPMKVVLDAGNGMAKVTVPKIISQLPLEVEYMYLEPDGAFPNHEANPLKAETLKALQAKVIETGADLGFALDGDADRVGFVDNKGEIVPPSLVGTLLGLEVLKKHPNSTMLYSIITSRVAKEVWEKHEAQTSMCQVGHALVKDQMKQEGAVFAFELSLHMYYQDMYDLEVPELSLLYMLGAMSLGGKTLHDLWKELDGKYFHSGEHNFTVTNREKVLENLKNTYSDAEITDIDGLLFTYPDFWFSIRLSHTEPLVRLNLEAKTKEVMEKKLQEVSELIAGIT